MSLHLKPTQLLLGLRNEMTTNERWIEHAYPLQQVLVKLQGTRHSDREAIINQLETVLARLRAGELNGTEHDDDFGYSFSVTENATGPSFFKESAGLE